ncbi:MAG: family 16 glycosylhydrolase, partial [Pseudomonadota bacterium]
YGRYEVVMQPSNTSGVISSFFTYTGPWFKNPHDEIDIEFLGKDTTSVYVNRFTAGKKLKGQFLPLGFDASKRPELYAFEWRPDSIIWHAAGKELYRTTLEDGPLPTHPSKIYINLWAGYNPTQELWAGRVADDATGAAKYFCVSYRAFDDDGPQCSDHFPPRAGAGGADR